MKFFKKLATAAAATVFALSVAATTGLAHVAAQDCFTVDAGGAGNTSQSAVFNNICNAPFGVGNERDFVRVRANTNGNVMDNQNNDVYSNAVTNACADGKAFDVWNYIHNDASPEFNNNGSGTAVAKDVKLALSAPLGQAQSSFSFGGKVSASNAASVEDSATLTCANGKTVKLSLVPGSVHTYSPSYGAWKDLADGSVNSTFPIGSPSFASGTQYGCWEYRIVVVYQVKVKEVPAETPTPVYSCDLFDISADTKRKATVTQFSYTAKNATFKNVVIDWGRNNDKTTVTNAGEVVNKTYQYPDDNSTVTYTITANVTFTANGKDVTATCSKKVAFNGTTPPTVTTVTTTRPTELPKTGAGSVMGMFAAAMAAGTLGYRWFLGRRLAE